MKLLPCRPDAPLDWSALTLHFDWIQVMKGCPQDPVHHAEGDVWTHVGMVAESLKGLPEWGELRDTERDILLAAVLLHDVAKPLCTRRENGRITARGHSARGAVLARRILWEEGADVVAREEVCALVRFHQIPFFLVEREDARRTALRISQMISCRLLAILSKADALGRRCADQADLLLRIGLFEEWCRENSCLETPWHFASSLSRFEYFRRADRNPEYAAFDASRSEVILMSGLPGSGKDSWLKNYAPGLPVISLDAIREEIGAAPVGNQGPVLQLARDRARVHLREGTSFAWNATNLTREMRAGLIDLFTDYGARVRIVHLEAPSSELFRRNEGRAQVVPRDAMDAMLDRWEVPDCTEAPDVEWWENDREMTRVL